MQRIFRAPTFALAVAFAVPAFAADLPEVKVSPANQVPACATPGRLTAFLRKRNPRLNDRFEAVATEYMRYGEQMGIRWDMAFFQMVLETGALSYTGDVRADQNNFAGLGASGGGNRGERFADIASGVKAHLQHLLMYAGDHIDNPVAERTRKVQEWGVLTDWQRSVKGPMTFTLVAKQWAPTSRGYVRDITAITDEFYNGLCNGADPNPERVQEARGGRAAPATQVAAVASEPKATSGAQEKDVRPEGNSVQAGAKPDTASPVAEKPAGDKLAEAKKAETKTAKADAKTDAKSKVKSASNSAPSVTMSSTAVAAAAIASDTEKQKAAQKAAAEKAAAEKVAAEKAAAEQKLAAEKAAAEQKVAAEQKAAAEKAAEKQVAANNPAANVLSPPVGDDPTTPVESAGMASAEASEKPATKVSGAEIAQRNIERERSEGQPRTGLGAAGMLASGTAQAAAAKPEEPAPKAESSPQIVILNGDKPADKAADKATAKTETAKADTPVADAPKADAKPKAGGAEIQTAAITGGATQLKVSPGSSSGSGKCKVWTASYGGQRAILIKASAKDAVNYTVLDVNEGTEQREVEAYISAYAKGGQSIGSFTSQTQALDKAFELCPEG